MRSTLSVICLIALIAGFNAQATVASADPTAPIANLPGQDNTDNTNNAQDTTVNNQDPAPIGSADPTAPIANIPGQVTTDNTDNNQDAAVNPNATNFAPGTVIPFSDFSFPPQNATAYPLNFSSPVQNTSVFQPPQNQTWHLADIHWVSGNLNQQYIAHHFCNFLYEGFLQCDLFNSSDPNGRVIGTEYFVNETIFSGLSSDEKKLWHSHPYEIKSGLFVVLDTTPELESDMLQYLMGTYGKVTDTWQYYEDFPLGAPQLGMALANDTQVDWDLASKMDRLLNLSTTYGERRIARENWTTPQKIDGADDYLTSHMAAQYQVYFINMSDISTPGLDLSNSQSAHLDV